MDKKILATVIIVAIAAVLVLGYFRLAPKWGGRQIPQGNVTPANFSATALGNVKVAIVYERLNDARPRRSIEEQIRILKDTRVDFILRASWRWNPLPNSCSADDIAKVTFKKPEDITPELKQTCVDSGYSFEDMKKIVQKIKQEIPNITIIGAIPAQKINEKEVNEVTGETFDEAQTAQMALDPKKWGISSPTKDEFQSSLRKKYSSSGLYPEITNPKVQELMLSWAKRQIEAGMDGVWIDLLDSQAGALWAVTNNVDHPAVKESYEAASKLVDEIHKYGESIGRHVYVGTWSYGEAPYPAAGLLDFVTESPTQKEIYNKKFDDGAWNSKLATIDRKFGNIPIFIFVDWADDNGQLAIFSQKLSKEEQSSVLREADSFFESKGTKFTYPVHGGSTGSHATVITYGKYNWYDSLAPEFQTYGTIKELAQAKAGG